MAMSIHPSPVSWFGPIGLYSSKAGKLIEIYGVDLAGNIKGKVFLDTDRSTLQGLLFLIKAIHGIQYSTFMQGIAEIIDPLPWISMLCLIIKFNEV